MVRHVVVAIFWIAYPGVLEAIYILLICIFLALRWQRCIPTHTHTFLCTMWHYRLWDDRRKEMYNSYPILSA